MHRKRARSSEVALAASQRVSGFSFFEIDSFHLPIFVALFPILLVILVSMQHRTPPIQHPHCMQTIKHHLQQQPKSVSQSPQTRTLTLLFHPKAPPHSQVH